MAGAGTGLPIAGAVLGLCLGGPVGLLAGAKLGGLAAIGGSVLGYTGASIIREQREVRRLLVAHTEAQVMSPPPSTSPRELSAPAPQAKRRRRSARVKETPREEEEEEEVGEVICPPHLHTRHWRRLHDKPEQPSILALIRDVEVRPGGDTQPVETLLVTAVVSAVPDSHSYQE